MKIARLNSMFIIKKTFWDLYDHLGLAIAWNLMWVVCSLPVVTVPLTTMSLFWVMRKVARKEQVAFKDFFKGCSLFYRKSLFIGLFFLVFCIFPLFNMFLISVHIGGLKGILLWGVSAGTLIFFLLIGLYFFPLVAAGNGSKLSLQYALFFIRNKVSFTGWLLAEILLCAFVFAISGLGIVLLLGSVICLLLNNSFLEIMGHYKNELSVDYATYDKRSLKEIFLFWKYNF